MILTSEVDNIMSGMVEMRPGHIKSIGVSTTNLIPGPTGEVPLAKQGAFQYETQVVEGGTATQPGYEEMVDLGAQSNMAEYQQPVGEAVVNETINDDPIKVADSSNLGAFNFKIPTDQQVSASEDDTIEKAVAETSEDIIMPEMPGVVGGEPEKVNTALFAGEQPAQKPEMVPGKVINPLDEMGNLGIGSSLEDKPEFETASAAYTSPDQIAPISESALKTLQTSFPAADMDVLNQAAAVPKFDFEELKARVNATIDQYRLEYEESLEGTKIDSAPAVETTSVLPELTSVESVSQEQPALDQEPDNLMLDAMTQISDIGAEPIDNSQIQGGRFMQS